MELSTESKLTKLAAKTSSGSTTINSSAILMSGFVGILITAIIDKASGTANFLKAEQADSSDGPWEDIAGARATPVNDGDLCWLDINKPTKPYIRASIVRAGEACAASEITGLQYDSIKMPTTNPAAGAKVISGQGETWLGKVATPSVTYPAADDIDVALDAELTFSTYAGIDTEAAHTKTQLQITEASDVAFLTPVLDVELETVEDLEVYQLEGTELDTETDYIIRVRYYAAGPGWSDWSAVTEFNTLSTVTVTGVSPEEGPNTGGTPMTLTGTDFVAGATVTIGGQAATSVVVVSKTQITCVSPAGTTGSADIVVTNTDGGTATGRDSFTYITTPEITSITPNEGANTGSTAITIAGAEFVEGATVTVNGQAATSVVVVSAAEITCETPAGTTGTADVVVTNTDGGTVTEEDGFTYVSTPEITTVTPSEGEEAGGTAITIAGAEFAEGATVTVGGQAATSVVVVSAAEITCVTPAGTGLVDAIVTNTDGGTVTAEGAFTYTAA